MIFPLWLLFSLIVKSAEFFDTNKLGTYLNCRNYSPNPSSSAKPFVTVSFNLARDLQYGHLRPLDDVLKSGTELLLIHRNTLSDKMAAWQPLR